MAPFAHCTALTVNAVKLPIDLRPRALAAASRLAGAVALDMTGYWRPTVRSYLGRVTKAVILEAVREGVGEEAAERLSGMKKVEMVAAAVQLLTATDWLPSLLRAVKAKGQADAPNKTQGHDFCSQAAE
jgi:ParB family chromosome partitioning protein